MDTAILTLSIMTLVSMIFSAFFSGMEIAFISSNSVRIKIDVEKKGLINSLISLFYRHKEMFITTMLVGNNIVLVVYSLYMTKLIHFVIPSLPQDAALPALPTAWVNN